MKVNKPSLKSVAICFPVRRMASFWMLERPARSYRSSLGASATWFAMSLEVDVRVAEGLLSDSVLGVWRSSGCGNDGVYDLSGDNSESVRMWRDPEKTFLWGVFRFASRALRRSISRCIQTEEPSGSSGMSP